MGNASCTRYGGGMPRRYASPYMTNNRQTAPAPCACADRESPNTLEACAAMVVAMAYVPWQQLETVYEPEQGFSRGTIFPELDKPLMVGGNCRG